MTADEFEAAIRDAYYLLTNGILARRDWLLSQALAGNRRAHDILCDLAELLTSDDKPLPLPLWLQRYVVLALKEGKAHSKRGRRPTENSERDEIITWAVYVITLRCHLRPTRNPARTTTESGCSIVAEALHRRNSHMTEANVNRIWLSGSGPDLLMREQVLANSLGPDLEIWGMPIGATLRATQDRLDESETVQYLFGGR